MGAETASKRARLKDMKEERNRTQRRVEALNKIIESSKER